MSKTITQKIYEDSYTDELYMQRTSDERLAQYGDNDFSFLNDNRTINVEFDLDADPPTLIEDSKRGKYDGENAALFYNSYKSMPIDLAFDKKFWTYMTHNNYRAYTMIRFNVKSRAAQGRAQGTVQERFFIHMIEGWKGILLQDYGGQRTLQQILKMTRNSIIFLTIQMTLIFTQKYYAAVKICLSSY